MRISVVVPVFNGEYFITQALDSIANQTYQPYEIIVVNDCSTDRTETIIERWMNHNRYTVRTVNHKMNKGIGASRQTGINNCKGDYCTFLSVDDYWSPLFLEKAVPVLNDDTAVFADYYQCDQFLNPFGTFHAPQGSFKENVVRFALGKNMFVNFSSVIFPRKIFDKCSFQSELRHGEDLIFLLDTVVAGLNYVHIYEPYLFYRMHPSQGSNLRSVDEWALLWSEIKPRLLKLGVQCNLIDSAMKTNYDLLYSHANPRQAVRRFASRLLNKSMFGIKAKRILKKRLENSDG